MSKFSSHCMISGMVCSIVWRATSLPSTLSKPVPPRPMPLTLLKGERGRPQAVVFEVELERVLAGRERIRSFPARALDVEEVIEEHGFAPQYIEPVAAEAAALSRDHAFGAAL